jgi:hypothetical protein
MMHDGEHTERKRIKKRRGNAVWTILRLRSLQKEDGWMDYVHDVAADVATDFPGSERTNGRKSLNSWFLPLYFGVEGVFFFFFLDIDCGSGFAEAWTFNFICLQRRDTPVIGYPHLVVVVAFLALLLARTFQGLLNNEMNEKKKSIMIPWKPHCLRTVLFTALSVNPFPQVPNARHTQNPSLHSPRQPFQPAHQASSIPTPTLTPAPAPHSRRIPHLRRRPIIPTPRPRRRRANPIPRRRRILLIPIAINRTLVAPPRRPSVVASSVAVVSTSTSAAAVMVTTVVVAGV